MRDNAIEQAQIGGFGGRHHACTPDELERLRNPRKAREEVAASPVGDEAQLVEYLPDRRLIRRHAVVTGEGQVSAAAGGRAVDRGDYGLGSAANGEDDV